MISRAPRLAATFAVLAILASVTAAVAKTHEGARSFERQADSPCTTDEGGGRRIPCGSGS
jgi:hypothetical protein